MKAASQPDLNALLVFAAVADANGFTAAADRLGIAKAKVSLQVSRLERALGASLFSRTTRRVTLTEAGRALYAECVPPLRGVVDALLRSRLAEQAVSGTLRISCTADHAVQTVSAAAAAFSALHPGVHIDLRSSDRVVDLVKDGVDLALRAGWLRDSSLRAVKLDSFEQHVVASPAYLARAGTPRVPRDLAAHEWVALSLLPTPLTWRFGSGDAGRSRVRVNARLRTDSAAALRALLEAGAGISVLDEPSTRDAVRAGRLQRVLSTWHLASGGLYAVFPPARQIAPAAKAFVDFYRGRMARSAPA